MNTFEEISEKLFNWANDRNILFNENASKQLNKLSEEVGELNGAYLKGKESEEKDSIGDILVVLSIYCHQRGLNINECFNGAWEEIKNRKGKTVNGSFVKEESKVDYTLTSEEINQIIESKGDNLK